MEKADQTTLQAIRDAGKAEFLSKGFRAASLRNIAKEAHVTTGAFYGYYSSKEALFRDLVDEQAQAFFDQFTQAQNTFAQLPPEHQPQAMGKISGSCMDWMIEYIYENFDAFKLILCCSEGTQYEQFIHTLVEIEVEATHRFLAVLQELGHPVKEIDSQLEHILVSGLFSGFFETVVHDMPKEQSVRYVRELREFYTAGWQKIMGLPSA